MPCQCSYSPCDLPSLSLVSSPILLYQFVGTLQKEEMIDIFAEKLISPETVVGTMDHRGSSTE